LEVWDTSGVLPAIRFQSWFVLTRRSFLLRGFLLFLLHFGIMGAFGEETVWLSWNVPDPSEGVMASQVFYSTNYYGTNSSDYTYSDTSYIPNGDLISGLVLGQTYYFAVAAVNTNGTVSALSQPLAYTVPIPSSFAMQYQVDRDYSGNPTILELSSSWDIPADWELQFSTDLQNWYSWQAGHGTAGGGNPDFSSWGDHVFFQIVLY
jgi:hypothetical protein